MKTSISLLALLALAGSTVGHAELLGLGKVSTDGSLEVLGQSADNEADFDDSLNDHRGETVTRVQVGVNAEVTEGVNARVAFTRTPSSNIINPKYGQGPNNVQFEQNSILVENAYVDVNKFLFTDSVRLGRQYAGRKGDLLAYFGPVNDDSLTVTSLDALSAWKKTGPITWSFVTGKPFEGTGAVGVADGAGDVNVTWITAGSNELIKGHNVPVELGYYEGNIGNGTSSSDNDNLTIMDFRAGYVCPGDMLHVMAEYARNGGKVHFASPTPDLKYKGSAFSLKASYDTKDVGLLVRGQFASSSGDNNPGDNQLKNFAAINADYRFGEILSNSNALSGGTYSGLDDSAGTGVRVFGFGASYTLPFDDKKYAVHGDYYNVRANKVVSGASKKVGSEIDLAASYDYSENVSADLGYAMLDTGAGLANGFAPGSAADDSVTKLYAKLNVKWGAK
jgi:hypothetical protein